MSDNEGLTKADIDAWVQRNRQRRMERDLKVTASMEELPGESGMQLLTPSEVAKLLRVDPKTVTRWATQGRITSTKTPGGHHRFYWQDIKKILDGDPEEAAEVSNDAAA